VSGGRFHDATAVRRLGEHFAGDVAPGWDIAGNANGGYLLAIAARALSELTGRPDPVTVTAHFLSPGRPGPVEIETREMKAGRRFTTATATLSANQRPLLSVLGTFGDLSAVPASLRVDGAPPELPALEECVAVVATRRFHHRSWDRSN
jgi:hypothetical protein